MLLHSVCLKAQLLWLQHSLGTSGGQGGSSCGTGGGLLGVQTVGFTLGFGDTVESSGEIPRILVVQLLCQCSAGLGGACQFLSA